MAEPTPLLWCWRHPRALNQAGHCIGRTDLPVDRRKAKRLAHRIRTTARHHGLPRQVWVSPLCRARDVGRWLQRWGFRLIVDPRLAELDFGRWDGRPWADIARDEVRAWQDDLLHHPPGGGESLAQLASRVQAFVREAQGRPRLVLTHGGWINALLHVKEGALTVPAASWPAPPPHGALRCWSPRS